MFKNYRQLSAQDQVFKIYFYGFYILLSMPMFGLAVCYVVFKDLSNYLQLIVFGRGCGMLLNVLFLKVDAVHIFTKYNST